MSANKSSISRVTWSTSHRFLCSKPNERIVHTPGNIVSESNNSFFLTPGVFAFSVMNQLQILCTSASTISAIHAVLAYPPETAINGELSGKYTAEVTASTFSVHFHLLSLREGGFNDIFIEKRIFSNISCSNKFPNAIAFQSPIQ